METHDVPKNNSLLGNYVRQTNQPTKQPRDMGDHEKITLPITNLKITRIPYLQSEYAQPLGEPREPPHHQPHHHRPKPRSKNRERRERQAKLGKR